MKAIHVVVTTLLVLGLLAGGWAGQLQPRTDEKPKEKPEELPPPKLLTPFQELLTSNKDLVPALVTALQDKDRQVRKMSANILMKLGKHAVPALVTALQSNDSELKIEAATILGEIGLPAREAMPALLQALKDDDPEVRQRVISAISRIITDVGTGPELFGPPIEEAPPMPPAPSGIAPATQRVPLPATPVKPGLSQRAP